LPYINPTKTVTVNYKVGVSFLGGTAIDEEHADGIKKAPYKHNALVSEEGPELI
jgi:hypothetical protein